MNREELLTVLRRTKDLMAETQGPRELWTAACLLAMMTHALENPEPVSTPVEDEDGTDVIRDESSYRKLVRADLDAIGWPIVVEDDGRKWWPFESNMPDAAKAQAYWLANYRFAVDETFDEETRRVVKLPANQGRDPDGKVVTFSWEGLVAVARYDDGRFATAWEGEKSTDPDFEFLFARLREWALANVPEGIEIVDGVPRYREARKEPEAFYVDEDGDRWHFVETPGGWAAVHVTKSGDAASSGVGEVGGSADALRAYLDARGIEWRKDGGA